MNIFPDEIGAFAFPLDEAEGFGEPLSGDAAVRREIDGPKKGEGDVN